MAATVEVKCVNKACGKMFTARVADRKRGWGKFCSKSCKAIKQEQRTGQYQAYKQRQSEDNCDDQVLSDLEAGWDGHKVWL